MLSVDRKALLAALETLKTVAPAKSGIPVLSNVSLASDGTSLKLSATDLYRSAWVTLPGDGHGTWSRAVDLRVALDRAKRFRNGHCTIGPASGGAESLTALCLSEGPREFTVRGVDPSDTPPLPSDDKALPIVTIEASTLAACLDRVLYAVSPDMTRPHLNSVRFEVTRERLRLVATDGHRLALFDAKIEGAPAHPPACACCTEKGAEGPVFLLSLEAVTALRSLCGGKKGRSSETVALSKAGSHVFAKSRGVTLAFRQVEAGFPPYQQVIPASSVRTVTVARALLAEVIEAIGPCADKRMGAVVLTLVGDSLTVTGQDPDVGKATEVLPVTRTGQEGDFTIGVNYRYLADALSVVSDDTVAIELSSVLDPIVMRTSEGGVNVVMPVRPEGPAPKKGKGRR